MVYNESRIEPSINPGSWVDDYGNYLFRYALSCVRDRAFAEDLVQETFVAALQSRKSFKGESSEKTWLLAILKHKVIDHFRRHDREDQLDMNEEEPLSAADLAFVQVGRQAGHWTEHGRPSEWNGSPVNSAERRAFWTVFDSCLSGLTPRMATVFLLREIDDMSTREICEKLNMTEANVWVTLHRARLILRRCIEDAWFNTVSLKRT